MQTHPSADRMYRALIQRDDSFEGIFVVGVKTTGIFCRPSCRARKPKRENVEFFFCTKDALDRGYRPCKVCHPMVPKGEAPDWVKSVLKEASLREDSRMNDQDIRNLDIDPNRLRRWFKQNHKMTFQAYLRSIRLGNAFGHLADGKRVIDTALDNGYQSLSGFSDAFKKLIGTHPTGSSQKNIIHIYQILTPLGPMLAAAVKEGVCLLEFTDRRMLETELKDLCTRFEASFAVSFDFHLKELSLQLGEYFQGKRKRNGEPLSLSLKIFA
ncbi:MAG: bifunctional transcriptional activator/DNA repair protein Ada [Planctomycetes bacterium]|nr:bifunctional transcriptional activator/DNA repair protein Ada [Planctomycetota bacterium]